MKRMIMKMCLVAVTTLLSTNVWAGNRSASGTKSFNWDSVINAIIQVESEGDPKAKSGNSCGAMQITPILVKECNEILKRRDSKKRYTLRDRYSVSKSKEMFLLMQSEYNPTNNVEQAIRAWNGGNNYSRRATQRYYEKVMKEMR